MILDLLISLCGGFLAAGVALLIDRKKRKAEKDASLFGTTRDSFLNVQKIINVKKVEAAEVLWKSVLGIRRSILSIVEEMDFCTEAEYKKRYGRSFYADFKNLDFSEFASAREKHMETEEEIRLFLHPDLWHLYVAYCKITSNIMASFRENMKTSEKNIWYKDEEIRNTIKEVLDQKVLNRIDQMEIGKIYWLLITLEMKVISSVSEFISGEKFEEESLERAAALQNKVAQMRFGFGKF